MPKIIYKAKQIGDEDSNTLWINVIGQKMQNMRIAFNEHKGRIDGIIGYK